MKSISIIIPNLNGEEFLPACLESLKAAIDQAKINIELILVDNASHIGEYTKESFKILFKNYLKKGGVYVIEDWGTGYWSTWPDGKKYDKKLSKQSLNSHQAGMVGFMKQLIDLLAFNDINKDKNSTGKKVVNLNIRSIEFFPGLCFVYKK